MNTQLVWFKRDLRVHDNAALAHAAALGPVMCVFIVEPSYWRSQDASQRQFDFLHECLRDLFVQLKACGVRLQVLTGEVTEVLDRLYQAQAFSHLHAHEETGNALTYERDKTVAGAPRVTCSGTSTAKTAWCADCPAATSGARCGHSACKRRS